MKPTKQTKTQKLIAYLKRRNWVTKTQIVKRVGVYHVAAEIWRARKMGCLIECYRRTFNGRRMSLYRML